MMRTRLPQGQPAIVLGVSHGAEALLADDHQPGEPAGPRRISGSPTTKKSVARI